MPGGNSRIWVNVVYFLNPQLVGFLRTKFARAGCGKELSAFDALPAVFGQLQKGVFFSMKRSCKDLVFSAAFQFVVYILKAIGICHPIQIRITLRNPLIDCE